MPTSADLLLDTSAAIALVTEDSDAHERVRAACAGLVLGLSGHALLETYSVLTRLPGGSRLSPAAAARVIAHEFPGSVAVPEADALRAVAVLAEAGIAGGAVYDGLVALAARSAGITLLTCDRRAIGTYAKLRVDVEIV
ncbi:PIN domain-containing protein [Microbacterium sp. NPDC088619]|uniref:PIN domain-containing protein n=1 Tax=Microbacterium sp. NPDC088619 TaxID=3364196 RepID=UPI0038085685